MSRKSSVVSLKADEVTPKPDLEQLAVPVLKKQVEKVSFEGTPTSKPNQNQSQGQTQGQPTSPLQSQPALTPEIPLITKSAPSVISSVNGTASAPHSTSSLNEIPPPVTPESVVLERKSSQLSRISLPCSERSHTSKTSILRSASGVLSRHSTANSIKPRTSVYTQQESLDLSHENALLKAQVESLRRLLQDSTASTKADRLAEDVKNKAKLIGKLERENANLIEKVQKLEKNNTASRASVRLSRRKSMLMDEGLHVKIQELENKLSNAPSCEQVAQLQENVCTLRQTMAEKDVALQVTSQKLGKAQDALVAAIDWETEVKLTQTRKALNTFVRHSASPEKKHVVQKANVRSATVNPSTVRSFTVPYPGNPVSPRSIATGVTVHDVMGRDILYYAAPGSGVIKSVNDFVSQPLTHLVYLPATGELKDQTGSTFLGREAKLDDTLSALSILADAAGCRHNIPAPFKSVVVAAHWVGDTDPVLGSH